MSKALPTGTEILREAVLVVVATVIATWFIGQVPQLRAWILRQWRAASG